MIIRFCLARTFFLTFCRSRKATFIASGTSYAWGHLDRVCEWCTLDEAIDFIPDKNSRINYFMCRMTFLTMAIVSDTNLVQANMARLIQTNARVRGPTRGRLVLAYSYDGFFFLFFLFFLS